MLSHLYFNTVLLLCTGIPHFLEKKVVGLSFGIPILFAVNILRLVVVFITGMIRPDLFEYMHLYFWQIVLIIFVLMLCLVWLRLIVIVRMKVAPLFSPAIHSGYEYTISGMDISAQRIRPDEFLHNKILVKRLSYSLLT